MATVDLAKLPPQDKIAALKEMGFTAVFEQHQPDCQSGNGVRCICIPPGTSWCAPTDVKEFMGETYQQLRDRKRQ